MDTKASESLKQIVETFAAAIVEAQTVELKKYVVTFESDGTPFRVNDKGVVALVGTRIWSTAFAADGIHVAAGLNEQLTANGSKSRVIVENADKWRARRVEKLQELTQCVRDGFAKQQAAAQ